MTEQSEPRAHAGDWVRFLVGLAVLVIGVWLLFIVGHGKPVAAPFTRVGGLTRVETAVHASHLWTKPPRYFVTTSADADQQTMLWAAQTAMAHDAPLLFTSRNGKLPRLVRTTVDSWLSDAKRSKPEPQWINVAEGPSVAQCQVYKSLAAKKCAVYKSPVYKSQAAKQCPVYKSPAAINRRNRILQHSLAAEMHGGVVDRLIGGVPVFFKVAEPSARLSTLTASNHLLPCPLPAARRDTLAPVVVFAVARRFPVTGKPAYPPDVAVGLALASHLAIHMTTASPKVSLVVVPRGYLEADPQLELQLRDQRGMVQGGVVLGSTRVLTDGTQALLRQILTSTDRQTLLDQVQADLGSVEPVALALLALVGLGAAAEAGRKVIPEAIQAAPKIGGSVAQTTQRIVGSVVQAIRKVIRRQEPSGNGQEPPGKGQEPPGKGQEPPGNGGDDPMDESNREPTTPTRDAWLTAIGEDPTWRVTVSLSSGWTVNGTVKDQDKAKTVLRINGAKLTTPQGRHLEGKDNLEPFVLVPVKDIAFITYGFEDKPSSRDQ